MENERNEVFLHRANLYPVHDGLYDAQFGSGYFESLHCIVSFPDVDLRSSVSLKIISARGCVSL